MEYIKAYDTYLHQGCTFISTRNKEEKKIQEKIVIFRFPKQIKQIHIPKIFHSQNIHLTSYSITQKENIHGSIICFLTSQSFYQKNQQKKRRGKAEF